MTIRFSIMTSVVLGFLALACAQLDGAEDRAPNILVFLVDDMGWQETSVPFHTERTPLNERYHTPNMERLAARGVKFTQAYAYAVCSPTRVSLMTGQSASRHRVTNWTLHKGRQPDRARRDVKAPLWNVNGLSPEPGIPRTVCAPTLAGLLREAGYHTIHVGKAHLGARDTPGSEPLNLGFDVNIGGHAAGGPGSYHGEHNYSAAWRKGSRVWDVPHLEAYHGTDVNLTEALTRETIKALDKATAADRPFFLYMSHYAIHAPWEKDHRFFDKYTAAGLSKFEATYASMVESMDRSLGDLLDYLERKKIADDTVVIFLSDNGQPSQAPRNRPLRGHKLTPYEGGIRVPMIASWPGVTPSGVICERYVMVDDMFPTVLEIAGVPLDRKAITVDGESFASLLREPRPVGPAQTRPLFWHYPNTYDQPPYTAMRQGAWKLIYHHADRRLELFDLAADLSEKNDLAAKEPQRVRAMAKLMTEHLAVTKGLLPIDKATDRPIETPLEAFDKQSKKALTPPPATKKRASAVTATSTFADRWAWVGPVVEEEGYHVWGGSPIVGPQGKVHLFVARWPVSSRFDPGWRTHSEIAHYVGDGPKGPFRFASVVARGDGDGWDASGHHNPNIQKVGKRYVLTYISNTGRKGHPANQRIGMKIADQLDGPWAKLGRDGLVLEPDANGWNAGARNGVNNPALLQMPDGRLLLYFKTTDTRPGKRRHSVMGVAVAERVDGPFVIRNEPITRNDRTVEDGYAFLWNGRVCLLTTDNHGILERGGGLLWTAEDGLSFETPTSGFHRVRAYLGGGVPRTARRYYGGKEPKFERPQVLVIDGEPQYLYVPSGTNLQGGSGTCLYLLERR